MSFEKRPRITNIWSRVNAESDGEIYSQVVIESTKAFPKKDFIRDHSIVLEAEGTVANMPEGTVEVGDGLVKEISLYQLRPDLAVVEILLEHPAEYTLRVCDGLPVRTIFTISRSFLKKIFAGKVVVIDPGHGGSDFGGRGPVNLLEKNVVLPVAQNLKRLLEENGAAALLTRNSDENLSLEARFALAKREKAGVFVSIHTHANKNSRVGGACVLYRPASQDSCFLASLVKDELVKKLKVADRGIKEAGVLMPLFGIPAIEVEIVTITNWVEEGMLRSPTVHKKAALGIFNGIKKYFAGPAGESTK